MHWVTAQIEISLGSGAGPQITHTAMKGKRTIHEQPARLKKSKDAGGIFQGGFEKSYQKRKNSLKDSSWGE